MAIPIQSQVYNPVSGVFGTGQVQFFSASGAWAVPAGIGKVRVRVWGGGGGCSSTSNNFGGGGGGGFAIKAIYDLSGVTSIAVTVGAGGTYASFATQQTAGTSSFGSYCSATGGQFASLSSTYNANLGGTGVGGDINNTGGWTGGFTTTANTGGGGGSASIFGNGGSLGNAVSTSATTTHTGGAGAAPYSYTSINGNSGFLGIGGQLAGTYSPAVSPTSGLNNQFSIDYLGTGGSGSGSMSGNNGGGGGSNGGNGGWPGGGSGNSTVGGGGSGLVIVEW